MMMAAFWELYMFHYILINSSWLRKRDAKRRSQLCWSVAVNSLSSSSQADLLPPFASKEIEARQICIERASDAPGRR